MLLKNHSLFSFGRLFDLPYWLDQLRNPFRHSARINFRGHPITIKWTQRAERQLLQTDAPLSIEMQLYFSCVIKKRVLFHTDYASETVRVNDNFSIAFNAVQAGACSPEEFVKNFPAKRVLDSEAALKMHPLELAIDYQKAQWIGEFSV